MATASDRDLLEAARRGDARALEALLEQHQAQIYRFGVALCRDPQDAEDVLQDTMVAMARSIRDFAGRSSLSTWLYTIARRFCLRRHERSKYAPAREESLARVRSEALPDPAPQPDEVALSHEIGAAVEAAIRSLEPESREVIVLRDIEGLKATEVAEVLDISVSAVKSRLHRARRRLRDTLVPALGIEPASGGTERCPDVLSLYSRHLEGEIDAQLCADLEAHLASCPRCDGVCNSLKRTLSLCRAAPPTQVPERTQEAVRAALRKFLSAR